MFPRGVRLPWRRIAPWVASLALFALLLPFAAHALLQPVRFNQFYLQWLEVRYGSPAIGTAADGLWSAYRSGVNILANRPDRRTPEWGDTLGVFRYVYGWVPSSAVVYPTEGIYYFRTRIDGRDVSGNIRVADLDRGRLTFAYFDRNTLETFWTTIDASHGLRVERLSPYRYRVEIGGRRVLFRIPDTAERPPRRLALLAEEDFVGRVYDESGVRFILLFNEATDSFYYLLDDERGTGERLVGAGGEFLVGSRTGFLYYDDRRHGRRLLVGVDVENVLLNNYLDGPADQVPFRAQVRDRVYRAYPGMITGPPLDPTGVIVADTGWARVALAPFNVYTSVPEMVAYLHPPEDLPPSVLWTYLTKETWNSPAWLAEVEAEFGAAGKTLRLPGWMTLLERGEYPVRDGLPGVAATAQGPP